MTEHTRFADLPVGARFRFSRRAETGLLGNPDAPGSIVYVKLSPRVWHCEPYGRGRVGACGARVWPEGDGR